MSEFLEIVLELIFYVIPEIAEVVLDFSWPDTRGGRIFWSVVIVILGGILCWELR